MNRPKGPATKDAGGQAMVEMALVLPLLLFLLLAIIQLGFVVKAYVSVTNSAREGARAGAVGKNNEEITAAVLDKLPTMRPDMITINISPESDEDRAEGVDIRVEVRYALDLILPLADLFLKNPMPIESASIMRIDTLR